VEIALSRENGKSGMNRVFLDLFGG